MGIEGGALPALCCTQVALAGFLCGSALAAASAAKFSNTWVLK